MEFRFDDWHFYAPRGVGPYQYDNLDQVVLVAGDFPQGYQWTLFVHYDGHLDPVLLTETSGALVGTIGKGVLSYTGQYEFQMLGKKGDLERHTNLVQLMVHRSLSGDAQWPEIPTEFTEVENNIRELNAHPPIPGDGGYWLIWDLLAHEYQESPLPTPEGIPGPQGPRGETGPAGPQGPKGDEGPRGPQGSKGDTGPKGEKGDPGPQGPKGDTGPQGVPGTTVSATGFWGVAVNEDGDLIVTYAGDDPPDLHIDENGDLIYDLDGQEINVGHAQGAQGPQGPAGEMGPQGPQGPAGEMGPQGPQGPAGQDGADGAPGAAATIEITETQTVAAGTPASFEEAEGSTAQARKYVAKVPQGARGSAGQAATVTIGTTATGEPGTQAQVTNSGTGSAAVLDFVIPRGAAGAQGPQGPKGDRGEQGPQGAAGAPGQDGLGVPTPTAEDAGKVPVVNGAGTGYELAEIAGSGTELIRDVTLQEAVVSITEDLGGDYEYLEVYFDAPKAEGNATNNNPVYLNPVGKPGYRMGVGNISIYGPVVRVTQIFVMENAWASTCIGAPTTTGNANKTDFSSLSSVVMIPNTSGESDMIPAGTHYIIKGRKTL